MLSACNYTIPNSDEGMQKSVVIDSSAAYSIKDSARSDSTVTPIDSTKLDNTNNYDTAEVKPGEVIDTRGVHPNELVNFAETLIGTPYLYGSVDPAKGLDCSGFINAVSNHFGIKVPRSSVEFTNLGKTIETNNAKPGDLILFTGTDTGKHTVGHIGIITDNHNGQVEFIHSSSGKANGVTISDLSGYYQTRFVKVIRIFPTAIDKTVA